MIFRLLLLVLIIWFLIWMFKKQFSQDTPDNNTSKADEAEDMLACAHCGTHVPKSLGVVDNDHFYCSKEHAELGPSDTK